MTIIDVHTHMLNRDWLELIREHGKPRYELRKSLDAPEGIMIDGAPFMTPMPGHFDYATRIERMDAADVDLAIVSLTCPNVYFGSEEISLKGAQIVNDDMAEAQSQYPKRIRYLASLPWEYPEAAVKELERTVNNGAVGVMVLANINGISLTDPRFAPVWQAIDDKALPVLVHPTAPPGAPEMDLTNFNLIASIGFMFDTSLCFSRMFFDGFLDRYPNLKLIASHAGGALPFLIGRLDQCFDNMAACKVKTQTRPSVYARRIYYDAVTFRLDALEMCVRMAGADRVMYGSDYPHNIGDMKGCRDRVDALPGEQAQAIRTDNALRIFDLKL
jgi:aminocarboxymuconate-semialdehyde decarboxylase